VKQVDRSQAIPGDVLTYRLTVAASGDEVVRNVILRDAVPDNTQYVAGSAVVGGTPVSDPAGGGSPFSTGINLGTLFPTRDGGPAVTVSFQVRVNPGVPGNTTICNSAQVSSETTAAQPSNQVCTTVPAQGLTTLGIAKTANPASAAPGGTVTFTITVTNPSSANATNVVVRDVLPAGLAYVPNSTVVGGSPVADVSGVSPLSTPAGLSVGTLAAGAQVVVTLRAVVGGSSDCPVAGTQFSNTGSVESDQTARQTSTAVVTTTGDVTPPSITIELPTSSQIVTRCDPLTIRALIVDGCPGVAPGSISILIDTTVVASGLTVGSDNRVTFTIADLSSLTLGPHILTIRAVDRAGNPVSVLVAFNLTCSLDCALELLRRAQAAGSVSAGMATAIRLELQRAQGTTGRERCSHLQCAFLLVKCAEKENRPGAAGLKDTLEAEIVCLGGLFGCPPLRASARDPK
jgi:uncharacterized repeat protein (TIGR01451 family)